MRLASDLLEMLHGACGGKRGSRRCARRDSWRRQLEHASCDREQQREHKQAAHEW
jgi:hypothetical protein